MLKKRSPLFVLFFTIFLDMLGLGILIPVIPVLLAQPLSPHYLLPSDVSVETGYRLLGVLLAIYSFGQFIAAPIIGQFSDKFGRKRILMSAILGTAVGHALFAVAILFRNIPLLFAARLFAGVAAGNIVVAQAAIADITTPENRVKNFGLIGAAFGFGFIIGPFIGGKLADPTILPWFNATVPFWFASALSLVNAFLVFTFFKETNMYAKRDHHIDWGRSLKNIAHALSLEKVRPLFITNFIYQTGFTFYVTFASVFLLTRFGFTEGMLGNYFAYVGVWIVFTQGVLTRYTSKKFSETRILQNSLIVTGLCILAILAAPRAEILYFIVPFYAAAIGLSNANMTALISRSAGPSIQGEVLGLNGSLNALAMTMPPLISGVIAAYTEPSVPLLIAAIITIFAGLYFINHMRMTRVA
jgi:DHA1 family tetracycline resistance protein-like MFS transporter